MYRPRTAGGNSGAAHSIGASQGALLSLSNTFDDSIGSTGVGCAEQQQLPLSDQPSAVSIIPASSGSQLSSPLPACSW